MVTRLVGAAAGLGLSLAAVGQTVEFRFVERTGKQVVTAADPVLELAVQARVNGGMSLGKFDLAVAILNEAATSGTLQRAKICNLGGTYFNNGPWIPSSMVGVGGMAAQFTYLATLSSYFNGIINGSGGTFTHDPSQQEIGLIEGYAADWPLISTPWIDVDGDGSPDLAGSGPGGTCPLDGRAAGPYFATGEFIDVYRFRYTVGDASSRLLTFTLRDPGAETFTYLVFDGFRWNTASTPVAPSSVVVTPLIVQVGSGAGPQGACCNATSGACTTVSQVVCPGGYAWMQGESCSLSICPRRGTCCDRAGACTFVFRSACAQGTWWTADGACAPNPCAQPGRCCANGGVCSVILATGCFGIFEPTGACTANACPGACCNATVCTLTDLTTCEGSLAGVFMGGGVSCGVPGNPLGCCPANFDGQGGVNTLDIFAFLNAWFAGDLRADFERNGFLDVFDVYGFVSAWLRGCP
jgi:hypothetical protein